MQYCRCFGFSVIKIVIDLRDWIHIHNWITRLKVKFEALIKVKLISRIICENNSIIQNIITRCIVIYLRMRLSIAHRFVIKVLIKNVVYNFWLKFSKIWLSECISLKDTECRYGIERECIVAFDDLLSPSPLAWFDQVK